MNRRAQNAYSYLILLDRLWIGEYHSNAVGTIGYAELPPSHHESEGSRAEALRGGNH